MDKFLYDRNLYHERVKANLVNKFLKIYFFQWSDADSSDFQVIGFYMIGISVMKELMSKMLW